MKQLLRFAQLTLEDRVMRGIAPTRETIAKFGGAHIVPIEAHPLGVPPAFRSVILGAGGCVQLTRLVMVSNILAILPEASRRGGEISRSLQAALDRNGAWLPTVVLAQEARAQLSDHGVPASVASEVKVIPGVRDRSYRVFMENWLAPMRAWYKDTKDATDYRSLSSDQSPYVIELGVINYEIVLPGKLLLQVAIKMIDLSNSRVIGRARAGNSWKMADLVTVHQAFAGDASGFKEAFRRTGRDLLKECVSNLGLLP